MCGAGSAPPPGPDAKIIPLIPGPALSSGQRRAELRDAALQVVRHLLIMAVPPSGRSPYSDQATGLGELLDAAGGPRQEDLLRKPGLSET